MKKHVIAVICFIVAFIMLAGCAPAENGGIPAVRETPPATPEPTPDTAAMEAEVVDAWNAESISLALPEGFFENEPSAYIMDTGLDRAWVADFAAGVNAELAGALERALAAVPEAEVRSVCEFNMSWQLLYALVCAAPDEASAVKNIMGAAQPEISISHEDGVFYADAAAREGRYIDILAAGGAENAKFMYVYANTLYGEDGAVKEYILPEAEGSLASGIVWPLASHTRLRKTWYADRDGGARRHTGTDIWAAEGTEIYSCTSGTVTGVYYTDKSGNTVIVTDDFGYEFHYYHMCVLTDFLAEGDKVEAGELIGYVGNTGNSSRDHLHLTIVSDDGVFINPYPYLEAVEP